MTNYYERCLKRINEAIYIELNYLSYQIICKTNCGLSVSQFWRDETTSTYLVSFKGANVPVTNNEGELLFNSIKERNDNLMTIANNKILEQL